MKTSAVRLSSAGKMPFLEIDGRPTDAAAYMTYFPENACYEDFAAAGYTLYSVCTYFTDLPINAATGFTPCETGVFDVEGMPDFSDFDRDVEQVLRACPNACIFPRIYISMPRWWLERYPEETIPTPTAAGREALYSQRFREDGAALLQQFIARTESMPYADHIIGYQVSGGNTQEWFYFDLRGGHHAHALPYFQAYLRRFHPGVTAEVLPELTVADGSTDEMTRLYYEFANYEAAQTVACMAATAKKAVGNRKLVGTFYGYSLEVFSAGWGTHALTELLESPHIDFFCSPVSYDQYRALGMDWCDMVPAASVLYHGKLYFLEADIRTHRTVPMEQARPGCKLVVPYAPSVFRGGADARDDILHLRKALAKALTQSRSLWWFDMFGGWYHCPPVMEELTRCRRLWAQAAGGEPFYGSRVAVFVDESLYSRHPGCGVQKALCKELALAGLPYDVYLLADFPTVAQRYKLVLLAQPDETAEMGQWLAQAPSGVRCIRGAGMEAAALRELAAASGVRLLTDMPDIVYAGNGCVALHSLEGGVKTVRLPKCPRKVLDGFENAQALTVQGQTVTFSMQPLDTVLLCMDME